MLILWAENPGFCQLMTLQLVSRCIILDTVVARRGRFRLDADGAALKPADFGKTCYVAGPSSVTTQAAAQQDIAAGRVSGFEPGSDGTNNAVWVNVGW